MTRTPTELEEACAREVATIELAYRTDRLRYWPPRFLAYARQMADARAALRLATRQAEREAADRG